MRQIKFRGKDPDTGRWHYGYYVRLERTTPYPITQDPDGDAKKFEAEQVDHYIFFTEDNDWGLETRKLRATVDPKTVGQFTGLFDVNKKEIYEGDVVAYNTPDNVAVIKWEGAGFIEDYGINSSPLREDMRLEVIGNIYENPNLIKE